jgi:solute:Na+ symporter, SSS family
MTAMLDVAIVAAFVIYSAAIGLRSRRLASRGLADYFLAGRSVKGWRAGLSMAATQYAADTPLLVAGLVAVGGIASLWRLWIYALAFLLMGYLLARCWRRAGVLTDAELVERRYSGPGVNLLRGLKAVYYGTVINCVVMAFVLVAATRIFEIFLPWHLWLPFALYEPLLLGIASIGLDLSSGALGLERGVATTNSVISIVLMLAFVALYSTTGGLRSVVSTDVLQFAFMMIGTLAYADFAVDAAGGRDGMLEALRDRYGAEQAAEFLSFVPPASEAFMPFLVVIGLQWFFQVNSDGTGYLAQRTMACRSDRDARNAAVVFTYAQVVVRSLLWLPIVIALLVVFPMTSGGGPSEELIALRELTFAQGIDQLLPPGLRGLMLTALLAALASTLDTHLNWGASYWSNDLYRALWVERVQKRTASRRELVLVARLSTVVILAIALAIMVNLGSIQRAWQMSLLFGAGIGSVLILRWLWERINLASEIAAIVVSMIAAPVLLATVEAEWLRLAIMSGVSLAAVVAAALWMAPTEPARLAEFYAAVEPPGWWSRSAAAAGLDAAAPRRRLVGGLAALLCAAAVAYALLYAGALLLLQPQRWPAAVGALLAAGVIVPVWRRYHHAGDHEGARTMKRPEAE